MKHRKQEALQLLKKPREVPRPSHHMGTFQGGGIELCQREGGVQDKRMEASFSFFSRKGNSTKGSSNSSSHLS